MQYTKKPVTGSTLCYTTLQRLSLSQPPAWRAASCWQTACEVSGCRCSSDALTRQAQLHMPVSPKGKAAPGYEPRETMCLGPFHTRLMHRIDSACGKKHVRGRRCAPAPLGGPWCGRRDLLLQEPFWY